MATIGTTAGRRGSEQSGLEGYVRRRRVLVVDDVERTAAA
jgi:hypothetical protein